MSPQEPYRIPSIQVGLSIAEVAQDMALRAQQMQRPVLAEFNGIMLTATPTTTPDAIVQAYKADAACRHAAYVRSPEFLQQEREAAAACQDHDARLQAALNAAPASMMLRDADEWQRQVAAEMDCHYGSGILHFADRWARLMEARMAEGAALESCAEESSFLANNEGITFSMYGAAVGILAQAWIHGEQLRRWHNLSTHRGDEDEAANIHSAGSSMPPRHRVMTILFLASGVLSMVLTGCALGPTYVHPVKGPQEFAADMSYCEALGRQAQHPHDYYDFTMLRVQKQCMVGRGWTTQRGQQ